MHLMYFFREMMTLIRKEVEVVVESQEIFGTTLRTRGELGLNLPGNAVSWYLLCSTTLWADVACFASLLSSSILRCLKQTVSPVLLKLNYTAFFSVHFPHLKRKGWQGWGSLSAFFLSHRCFRFPDKRTQSPDIRHCRRWSICRSWKCNHTS